MTILDGKILYKPVWNLRVVLSPEFIVDYVSTHSAMQQKNYVGEGNAFPFENLVVKIFYDDICLLQHQFLDLSTLTLEKNFDDTEEFADHKLKIFFSGADIDNNFVRNNHTITLGINAKLYVEGIDISGYLNNHACFQTTNGHNKRGMNTITENGHCLVNMHTPIYIWLFCNEQAILDSYCQKG